MKIKEQHIIISIILAFSIFTGCDSILPSSPSPENVLNKPIEGLNGEQLSIHLIGDVEFSRVFSAKDGLGPIFVTNSCESCHSSDGKGHPFVNLTRFGRLNTDGSFDHLIKLGGPQLQQRAISGYLPEEIPNDATGVTVLLPPAVAGLGYLAAVSDSVLLSYSDPTDANGDGISGVPNYIDPPQFFVAQDHHIPLSGKYIGRFGRKASAIDLLHQTSGAYINDIGITSIFFPNDLYNYKVGSNAGDNAPDPEIPYSTVNNVVFYLRTLSVPPRRNINNPDVLQGEKIFAKIGCNSCHIPSLRTGISEIEALNKVEFHPYTDLLLHDMGAGLDDKYTEGTAKTSEWRTTPLWGLGLYHNTQGGKAYYLHDGKAKSLEQAIEFHGGESKPSADKFKSLNSTDRDKLILFLLSL